MLRLQSVLLVPAALTLLSFEPGAEAIAQTTYPFNATYNLEITTIPLAQTDEGIVLETDATGESADAPYGLTNLTIGNYAAVDPGTGVVTYGPSPAAFGLEGLPPLDTTVTLFGNGSDKLFGTNSGSVSPEGTGSGTITITGGEGKFIGATGTLDFSQINISSPDPTGQTAPVISAGTISGSFQAVPEPGTNTTLIGVGMIGFGFLLHSRRSSRKGAV